MNYDAEQQNRKNRAIYESMRIVNIDRTNQTAIIENSEHDSYYTVTIDSCTCPDFQKRGLPCKHIYRLRNELNLSDETISNTAHKKTNKKVKQPATIVALTDKPDISFIVVGIIILIVAYFFSRSSIPVGIIVALIGVYPIYEYISFKRHPDNPKYITPNQLERWQQLISSNKKTVNDLQKASIPVLLDLKSRTESYYTQLSTTVISSEIRKCSKLLLQTQQKIIDLSEFIVLKGDNPQQDFDKYTALVDEVQK